MRGRLSAAGLVLTLALASGALPLAQADQYMEFLAGSGRILPPNLRRHEPPPRQTSNPVERGEVRSARSGGTGGAYCVRLCDGRYFPLARVSRSDQEALCEAFCPAAASSVYRGADIERATAADGSRYGDLLTAFVYRDRLIEGCTCNGRDAFGLAAIPLADDPTLRNGDRVATAEGTLTVVTSKNRSLFTAGTHPDEDGTRLRQSQTMRR